MSQLSNRSSDAKPETENTLYVVGTPIGNLEDITMRALRTLGEVGLIAAEDTRVTRRLLDRYDIRTRLTSYNEHNSTQKIPMLLEALESTSIALVSDAGMPGVNDPGQHLVRAVAEAGYRIEVVPGPSSITTAISVSGLDLTGFVYVGFLPRKTGERKRVLGSLMAERRGIVALESPHRIKGMLKDIYATLGDRKIAVCRELTKLYEEVFRGTVSEAIGHFVEPRGEFTVVVQGLSENDAIAELDDNVLTEQLSALRSEGLRARDAVRTVVENTGTPRSRVYALWIALKDN